MNIHLKSALHLFAALLLISACGQQMPTPDAPTEPVAVATVIPAPTSTPTYTPMPNTANINAPTVTIMPTPDYTITPVLIPTSDVPLNQNGPWLILRGNAGDSTFALRYTYLWATNADGTGLTQLTDGRVLAFDIQPGTSIEDGAKIAYVIFNEDYDNPMLTLKTLTLPSQEIETVTLLNSQSNCNMPVDPFLVGFSIINGGLTWSPDGRILAFVGAMDGEDIEVYNYDIVDKSITRLTDDSDHATALSWSPDGMYVTYEGFEQWGMGSPISSSLSATAIGNLETTRFELTEGERSPAIHYEGWFNSSEIALFTYFGQDYESSIHIVNIASGEERIVDRNIINDAAYAPEHDVWLEVYYDYNFDTEESLLHLFRNGHRYDLPNHEITDVRWLPMYDVFLAVNDFGEFFAITPTGEITSLSTEQKWDLRTADVIISPEGSYWAWRYEYIGHEFELWIGPPMQQQIQITDPPANIIWAPDSQHLIMYGYGSFWIASRPDFVPVHIDNGLFIYEAAWLP